MTETQRRSAVRRVRRRVARWAAPELDAELRATKRKLQRARAELRDARAPRRYALPPEVEADDRARARRAPDLPQAGQPARARRRRASTSRSAGLPGLVIEAGTARGGSAIVMAAAKAPERPMKVYDVFGMIPPPTERDGADVHERYEKIAGGERQGRRRRHLLRLPRRPLRRGRPSRSRASASRSAEHNVELVQGLFEDTIDLDEPVAFAHLDGDWYESTMTCLTRIAPLLVPGGRIVLDDYYKWSGCRPRSTSTSPDRDGFRLEQPRRSCTSIRA